MRQPKAMYPKLIYIEGSLLDQADRMAEQDRRFFKKGRPSSSAIIRKATEIFFALPVRYREQLLDNKINDLLLDDFE